MRFTRSLSAALVAASLGCASLAFAHGGGEPKHGGAVSTASDLAFELAGTAEGAALYIEDHGKPFPTQGLTGKLVVLNGADRAEAALEPAGGNRMDARGVKIGKGTKSVATITLPNRKNVTVRFSRR